MKKAIAVAVLAVAASCVAQAQDVAGDWLATLTTNVGRLRIVLHIVKSPDGTLKATFDSPDQGVGGLIIDSIALDGNKLKFAINPMKVTYEGTVRNTAIKGNWTQGQKWPLEFERTTTPPKLDHPPAPPSDIDGRWEGLYDLPGQGRVHVVFHVKNTGDGLTATMESAEMNVKNWPATSVTRKGSSLKIEMNQVGGTFEGKVSSKDPNVISGDWNQGGNYVLALKRMKEEPGDASKPASAPAPPKN